MFVRTPLASAIAVTLGLSTAGMGVAQADDSIFFPYFALGGSVTTVVSVINTSVTNWDQSGGVAINPPNHLHYRLYYKGAAAAATDNCQEYNEFLPTSPNDIQTIDLGGHFGSTTQGVLFNDPSVNNNWQLGGRDYAMGRWIAPARGYLYVDNADATTGKTLHGEAFVFEFGSGAAWGYTAFANDNSNRPAIQPHDYRWAASTNPYPIALMPLNETTTALFVTPVSMDQAPDFNNNYRGRIQIVTTVRGDLYDRDENLISGTVPQDFTCVARINARSLLTDGTARRLQDGGWGMLQNFRILRDVARDRWVPARFRYGYVDDGLTGDLIPDPNATNVNTAQANYAGNVVIKLEYNEGFVFNGETTTGTYNNAIVLPSQDNITPFAR